MFRPRYIDKLSPVILTDGIIKTNQKEKMKNGK